MSPSRGHTNPSPTSEATTETRADNASRTALTSAKQNLKFLLDPSSTTKASAPHKLRTRALLRSLRYIGIFVFWRIVRYAKYALVGSAVAALGATAFGGMVSGVGFLLAPPTLVGSLGIGAVWAVGKWGFRKMGVGARGARQVEVVRDGVRRDGEWRDLSGPDAAAW